jgi:DNA-directed RNA polymerase subunit RPC12/RpoP
MAVLQEFKCPCCDGGIAFDSASQKMKCPYCDTEFDVDTLMAYQSELDSQGVDDMSWESTTGKEWTEDETTGLRTYVCKTCSGEILGDASLGATECPFCGNPVVMKSQFEGVLKPDLVIPFKLDKKAAVEALKKHYSGKVLLPKVFKDENRIQEVKGIYVPFWLFEADADAHIRYKATRVRSWSDSNYIYTETQYYSVIREGDLGFSCVPVDGSSKMDDTLMESIEPYNVAEAVDFQTAYLSGYLADKYDVTAEQSVQRANARVRRTTEDSFANTVKGFSSVVPEHTDIRLQNGKARYALYPVWLLNTTWKDKKYTFAMNGQTGKIVGDLPMDKGAFWRWFFLVGGITAAVVFGTAFLLMKVLGGYA